MGKSAKRMRKVQQADMSSDDDEHNINHQLHNVDNEKYAIEDNHFSGDDDDHDDDDEEEEYDSEMDIKNLENEEDVSGNEDRDTSGEDDENEIESDEQDDDGTDMKTEDNNHADMEELEKEYNDLRHEEQDLFRNIWHNQDEDLQKGQAVKNQRALWDKTLEFRFLLQKSFSISNRLPQESIRSAFCNFGEGVKEAYADLIDSTKKTLDSIFKLQGHLLRRTRQ